MRISSLAATASASWAVFALCLHSMAAEPLGPSSRRTALVISELMHRPAPQPDGTNLQFVELYNSDLIAEDLSGFALAGDVQYTFPEGTTLPAGRFLAVAPDPVAVAAEYQLDRVLGGFEAFPRGSGTIQLRNRAGAILLEIEYGDRAPWPVGADGAGHSLVLARPSLGEGDPRAWAPSRLRGGSPGRAEPTVADPLEALRINEFLASPVPGQTEYIELYNTGSAPVDLSGCILSDSRTTAKFAFPQGTTLAGFGHVAVTREQLGFGLAASGERIYLRNPSQTRVLDAVRFEAQEQGISMGRSPDGAADFAALDQPTPGSANAARRIPQIVINEIMYHAPSRDDLDGFVELHNRSPEPVSLAGWRLEDGIRFEFPSGASIPSGGYVVVAKDAERLIARYPALDSHNTFGNFSGRLSFSGERIALTRPRDPDNPAAGYVLVNEVTYRDGGRWPDLADGGGSSLELIDARSDNRLAPNWAASNESAKAEWTLVEHTGVLDHGAGSPGSLHILLMGEGECLVDNVEVFVQGGANLVANSTFESGVNGWSFEGTHRESGWEAAEGFQSNRSLRVRAAARGDTGANRIRTTLTSAPQAGRIVTIRARVRWLSGTPEIVLRLLGNHLEAAGHLSLPSMPGTPGERNSRSLANAGPAITEVSHAPILPQANQSVRVTARVHDPDGIASVRLRYRIDPSSTWLSLPMRDDGISGDLVAGDGIFTATISGRAAGTVSAFYIEADDGASPAAPALFPADAPRRECLIRWGELTPPPGLSTYRIWMTQETRSRWMSRSQLDNTPLDITFVYDDQRVIYNAGGLYAGSPHIAPGYNRPDGNLCGYTLVMPKDDRFMGVTDVRLDWPGRDETAQQEPFAYFLARELGLPFSHRRFIHLHVNGVTSTQRGSVFEDTQQINSDFVSSWMPGQDEGELFKIEQWFEFADSGGRTHTGAPRLGNYTTTGGAKKTARYRWNWLKRAVKDSAHDYQSIFNLADAANAPVEGYVQGLETIADIEQWMRIFATEHIVVNFDSYGSDIGKNMYAYKPGNGRWNMFMWDIDWVMLPSAQHGYSPTSPLMYRGPTRFGPENRDPAIGRMYNEPAFQRAYWRAIRDAVNGPLRAEIVAARMDATHSALVAAGVSHSAGRALASPQAVKTWLAQRRNYLLQQLQTVAAPFSITSPVGATVAAHTNYMTIAGTAPIAVKEIRVNGISVPVTWTSVTEWSLAAPVRSGTHPLRIEGFDLRSNPIDGAGAEFVVHYDGPSDEPREGPFINEWMASNRSIPHPLTGLFEDWIELFNPNAQPIDLSGYFLSDSAADPQRFAIPGGVVLPANGYLVIWADGAGGITNGVLGASFRLDRAGEEILLSLPDGRLLDHVSFGTQMPDISQGRFPDGAPAPYTFFNTPTPGSANSLAPPPALRISGLAITSGQLRLEWASTPGRRYRVVSTENLASPDWQAWSGEITATTDSSFALLPVSWNSAARFYRVQQVD